MHGVGLRIIGIGLCLGFFKDFTENYYINAEKFLDVIPKDVLNEHFGLGAGFLLVFDNENDKMFLTTNARMKCKLNGKDMIFSINYPIYLGETMTISIGEYEFAVSVFISS